MTVLCIRCGEVMFRYAPVEDELSGLCGQCASVQIETERSELTCGHDACPFDAIPYECLVASATADGSRTCPGLSA
jgi:hypothetical protein